MVAAANARNVNQGFFRKPGPRIPNVRKPLEILAELPTEFDWGNVNGVNYLTNIRN